MSNLVHEALDALCARSSQHRLGEVKILGLQLGVRKRIFGVSPRTRRFRNELATVVQHDLDACPSLGRKQPRIFAIFRRDHEPKQAPHTRPVGRLDEVKAVKQLVVKYGFGEQPVAART